MYNKTMNKNTTTAWITADLHFSHSNILKFNPATRQYTDSTHMDEMMILDWNNNVQPQDTVFILGDVAFCNVQKATSIVRRLNGRKILVEGNHDVKLVQDIDFVACFEEIHKYHEINVNGNIVCMSHYPMLEWNQCHRGSIMFHGHVHGGKTGMEKFRMRDVGMDATGNVVTNLHKLVSDALKGEIKVHHS